MPTRRYGPPWTLYRKPSGSVRVDRAHPLAPSAYWLIQDGSMRDLVSGTGSGSGGSAVGPYGPEATFAGPPGGVGAGPSALNGPNPLNAQLLITRPSITVALFAKSSMSAAYAQLVCRPSSNIDTPPYQDFSLFVDATKVYAKFTNQADSGPAAEITGSFHGGDYHFVAGTWDGSTITAYFDDATATTSLSGTALAEHGQEIVFAGDRGTGSPFTGSIVWAGIWPFAMTGAQVADLRGDPYQFIVPMRRAAVSNVPVAPTLFWRSRTTMIV